MTTDPNETFTIIRSDADWEEVWSFFSDAAQTQARVLTGYTASAGLKRRGSDDAAFSLTTVNDLLTVSGNTVTIAVPAANSEKVALAPDYYDLWMVLISPGGVREPVDPVAFQVETGYAP